MNGIEALLHGQPDPENVNEKINRWIENFPNDDMVRIQKANRELWDELEILENKLKNLGFFKSSSVKRRIKEIKIQLRMNIRSKNIIILENKITLTQFAIDIARNKKKLKELEE